MGRRTFTAQWPGEFQKKRTDIQPDPKGWLLATQRPVAVVVGELDLKPIRHVRGIGGDTHVDRAKHWVELMNQYAESFDKRGLVELVLMPNVGHNFGKLARKCQQFLESYVSKNA